MINFKTTIIYATMACVAALNTLELHGDVVYGQTFNLVCFTVTNASYQTGVFFRSVSSSQSGTRVASIAYSNFSCTTLPASFKNYTYSCSNEGKNMTLTVPAENDVEHDTFWRCANQESINEGTNNVIRVFVNDPVRHVTIANNTVVTVTEGMSERFVCETSPCRPSAEIHWMKNGINITNTQGSSSIHQSGTKNITTTSLQFTTVRGDNGSLLACGAYNGYGTGKLSANVIVVVHYSPVVNNFTSPLTVIQGQPLEVLCSADGNPIPQLTWNPLGEDRVNRSRLYYTAISRDKAVVHTCTATNNMVPTAGNPQTRSDSKQLLIDVLYSPIVNNFTSPVKVMQGHPLVVVCRADGNPSPQLTWNPAGEDKVNRSRLYYSAVSRDKAVVHTCTATNNMVPTMGSQLPGSDSKDLLVDVLYSPVVDNFTSPVKVIQGQPLEVLCIADGNPSPQLTWNPAGEDKVNKSRLYYSAISRDKAVIHTCTATNNMVSSTGSPQTGSDSKQLLIDVLYSPIVNNFTLPEVVIEGQPLEMVCRADGNPPPQLKWNPSGEDTENRSRLYYSAISRDKAVIHTCTATNNMVPTMGRLQPGSNSKELLIDVLYNASISIFTSKDNIFVLIENSSLQLLCQIDSNPYAVISLYFENDLKLEMENALNLNYTKTATCLDAGKYTCSARNKIMNGDVVSKSIQINITCSPKLDHRKNVSTVYYTGLNSNITLEVHVIAYPEPTHITWYHRENETDIWHRVTYQPPSSGGLFSSILIQIISMRDFGYYMVSMDNYLGNVSNRYSIIHESIPEVPRDLNVTESGPDSVTLEWAPGFHGGHPQHFIIEYATQPDGDWLKSEEIQDVGSPKQSFILPKLKQKTTYQLRMYAENIIGHSEKTQVIKATTSDEGQADAFLVGAVAGGISGAVVTVVVVILVLIVLRRGRLRNKDKAQDRLFKTTSTSSGGRTQENHGKKPPSTFLRYLHWLHPETQTHADKGGDFTKELQADGKSIKNRVYANAGAYFIPTGGEYEALQANRNEGSFYQELSDIKSCADTNCSLRRNVNDTTGKYPTYANTIETTIGFQDQGNLTEGENKIYENTTVQA